MAILFSKRLSKYYLIGERAKVMDAIKLLQNTGAAHINYVDTTFNLKSFESDVLSDSRAKNEILGFLELNKNFSVKKGGNKKVTGILLRKVKTLGVAIPDLERRSAFLESEVEKVVVLKRLGLVDLGLLNYRSKISLLKSKHNETIKYIRKTEFDKQWFYLVDSETAQKNGKLELINTDSLLRFGVTKINYIEKELRRLIRRTKAKHTRLEAEYRDLFRDYGSSLSKVVYNLSDDIIRKKSIKKIADEGKVFIVSCFVPEDFNPKLLEDNGLKVIKADFSPKDAPTVKPRGAGIGNFAFLTWLYGVPRYNEVEPSFALLITFPLLFGAIVGDIGYGLVLLFGAIFLYRFHAGFRKNLFWIFTLSAVSSIFFGALFGEFFGNLIVIQPLLFYRLNNVLSLIFGSILGGSIILSLAFIFNEINAIIDRDKKHIIGGAGWLLLNSVILYEVVSLYFYGGLNAYAALAIPLAAIMIGVGQLYEVSQVLNLFTNVVSYLRIAAVGLSSIMIALLINQLGNALINYSIFVAIFVIAFLHLLNIVLDALIAFLQSLRLEYVEFLSKFLNGNGAEYEPLAHVEEKQ